LLLFLNDSINIRHDRATLDGYCGVFTGALVDGQEDSVKDESSSTSHRVSLIALKIYVFHVDFSCDLGIHVR